MLGDIGITLLISGYDIGIGEASCAKHHLGSRRPAISKAMCSTISWSDISFSLDNPAGSRASNKNNRSPKRTASNYSLSLH